MSIEEHYKPEKIETETQAFWESNASFKVVEAKDKAKFYCLSMFPYPSGRLHMGHVRNYTIGDVIARYQRMLGKNVLQPMGWDAFGMPAENAAIKNRVPPAKWTYENIAYMREQLKRLGFGYDWDRELATCDPDYYRWEQWLFTRLFAKGLVYKKTAPVNWCPKDLTVLANEQVIDGRCWRCDTEVVRKEIPQYFMKITDYAQELLDDIDKLDNWPDQVRTMQRNWIGRSQGVELEFAIAGTGEVLKVFTTRPDTLLGVSYVAVAPEHPLAAQAAENNTELAAFIQECKHIETSEAAIETMEKKGVRTGLTAVHPITSEEVPVFAANFVLMGYGEGAVMAVPAHDQRDWEFAQKYGLPVKQVIRPADGGEVDLSQGAFVDKGVLVNSGQFDGLTSQQAFDAIAEYLARQGKGNVKTNYRLRDWGVSRQRYWGTPIPIVNCSSCGEVPVPESELPVVLPEDVEITGEGSPLAKMPEFYQTACPKCAGPAKRETDTFDTFFESSWYFARYACPDYDQGMLDDRARYWLPVDQYIGGIEHAVLHLLYARFFNKLMRDEGLVGNDEPFSALLTQGMVVAETYYREDEHGHKHYVAPTDVEVDRDDKGRITAARLNADGQPVTVGSIEKMSKSKQNGIDPQALIDRYGADTVRLFTMFASPPDQSLEWNDAAVEGSFRFLKKVWRMVSDTQNLAVLQQWSIEQIAAFDYANVAADYRRWRHEIHSLLEQANRDVQKYQFNTVVAAGMKMMNTIQGMPKAIHGAQSDEQSREAAAVFAESVNILLRMLAPIVPHMTHTLWRGLNFGEHILDAPWPEPDAKALQSDSVEMGVQVNGKLRAKIDVPAQADKTQIEAIALSEDNVARHIEGKHVVKVVVVPKRLVNIVVK
ncbi:MAG: leucine--tRNA ligase [Gammaproteobacteria bacterium]|nr:leucine--tRNA ligase [Gammaproteobacteria bacterium]